jgi:Ni,Fe-hydrogenase III small subunit
MTEVMTKKDLLITIGKFLRDENRGISIGLFAELCNVNMPHMRDVFIHKCVPLTEAMQRKIDKGYKAFLEGRVAVMENRDGTRYIEYRKTPKPRLVRSTGLELVNGQIKVKVGIRNKADYSTTTLDEQLRRK